MSGLALMNIHHDTGGDAEAVLQDSDATGRRRVNFKIELHFFPLICLLVYCGSLHLASCCLLRLLYVFMPNY